MLISVVMPIHNSGLYLTEAVESLMMQEFRDFEIILVDDASDDMFTKQLLKNIDKGDNGFSIKVIYLDQSVGAAEARNIGFQQVAGVYTIFLDSDDIFAPDFLKNMYQGVITEDADVSICGFTEFSCDQQGNKQLGAIWMPEKEKIQNREKEEWLLNISIAPWNKLCRTEYLRSNNIYFQNLSSCNDLYFTCIAMKYANKISVIEETSLIKYRTHVSTQISANRDSMNLFYSISKVLHQIKNDNIFIRQCAAFLLIDMLVEISRCKTELQNRRLYESVGDFFRNLQISFTNKIIDKCKDNVIVLPYENDWYRNFGSFEWKLRLMRIEILKKIKNCKNIYLWGMGRRGHAFEKFCLNESIFLQGVADKKNNNIGEFTELGNLIVKTEEVIRKADVIIASNAEIYNDLLLKKIKKYIFNLEEYCP